MGPLFSRADLRQAFRRLLRERGFTATVLLTFGICIAANVAIFAVVDAILVRALPYPEPDRLVVAINSYPGAGVDRAGASVANYFDRRHAIPAFSSVALYRSGGAVIGEAGSPDRVDVDRVTPEFFATLGVPLALGRTFTEDELADTASPVAVLTDAFWRKRFNADPQVPGKTFQVDGQTVAVAGVLPPGFRFLSSRAQFFLALSSNAKAREPGNRHSNNTTFIARLAPGATVAVAQAQMDALNATLLQSDPYAKLVQAAGYRTGVYPLHADYVREIRPVLLLLQGGVFCLLLIGGVNLVNLLLIRASGRAKELAVRQALGAGRRHLARDVLLETGLLGLGGGALGLALGALGIRLLNLLGTEQLPLGSTVAFDGRVAGVALVVAVLTGGALALPILWYQSRLRLAPVLQAESRGGTTTRAAQRLRHGFIILQVAAAFVLLSGAGLLGASLQRVLATPPGFRADHVLTGRVALPRKAYADDKARIAFVDRLMAGLRGEPGLESAAISTGLPMSGNGDNNAVTVEGAVLAPGESIRAHYTSGVTADFFKTMGIPLREGRLLEEADGSRDQKVCVVDEAFAHRYWPGQSALGRRLVVGPTFNAKAATTIVGVVGNVKQNDLAERTPQGAAYFPYGHYVSGQFSVVLRTQLPPEALAATLKRVVLQLDPQLPVDDVKPMQALVDESLVSRRSPALLAGIFAGIALLLSAVGTYGVLAYAVSQRTREIGVRMALGAQPGQVLAQFLGLGARLLAAGLVLGAIGAWFTGRAMQGLLFGVGGFNAVVLAIAAAVLVAVVLVATFLPSRRAARTSPIEALRSE